MKTVTTTEAENDFSALLSDVEEKHESVLLVRDGKKVARLLPIPHVTEDPIFGFYQGKLDIKGDVISPVYSDEELDEFDARKDAMYR